jgi:hypothetical protein
MIRLTMGLAMLAVAANAQPYSGCDIFADAHRTRECVSDSILATVGAGPEWTQEPQQGWKTEIRRDPMTGIEVWIAVGGAKSPAVCDHGQRAALIFACARDRYIVAVRHTCLKGFSSGFYVGAGSALQPAVPQNHADGRGFDLSPLLAGFLASELAKADRIFIRAATSDDAPPQTLEFPQMDRGAAMRRHCE